MRVMTHNWDNPLYTFNYCEDIIDYYSIGSFWLNEKLRVRVSQLLIANAYHRLHSIGSFWLNDKL